MTGSTLSHYKVLEPLGSGGMGEVFKARDTRLNRLVAIKILKPEHVSEEVRKQRFIQEAQAASALNHPNIVIIYDFDQQDGVDFMVMEYIAGRTLDARIPRQGMRVSEALRIAVQITEGLRKAHAAGIVHRDLKPSNIMVADDGLVKILDFGLAKLTETVEIGEEDATRAARPHTEDGAILGTAAYMSPEQAEGRKLDARTDIFSFGAMLYEMLTGHRAFAGDTRISSISAILKDEPKPVENISSDLEKVLRRCLRKDRERRFQHMDDLRVALLEVKEDTESGASAPVAKPRSSRRWMLAAATLPLAALGLFFWMRSSATREVTLPAVKVVPITSYPGVEQHPSFSPDGNQVAFSWNGEKRDNFDIYVKLLDSPTPLRLTIDASEDMWPAWSPDGRQIAFVRNNAVYTVPAIGGPEQKISDAMGSAGVAWHPDARHVVLTKRVDGKPPFLALVPIGGGDEKALTSPPPLNFDGRSAISPDGRWLAFVRMRGSSQDLLVKPLDGGSERPLVMGKTLGTRPVWTADSRELIYGTDGVVNPGAIWRIDTAAPDAKPVAVSGTGQGANDPAVSTSKTSRLAFSQQRLDTNIWRYSLDAPGKAAAAQKLIASTYIDQDPQYSPDGRKIAYIGHSTGAADVWVCDQDGQKCRALTSHGQTGAGPPRWSPDSRQIVFGVNKPGNADICAVPAEGGAMTQLTTDPSNERRPSVSMDGKWLYFASDRSGRSEIWKKPLAAGNALQVTHHSAFDSFESPDGKLLYFHKGRQHQGIWSTPVEGGPETLVVPQGRDGNWAVAKSGLYFVDWDDAPAAKAFVYFYSFATKQTVVLTGLPIRPSLGPRFSIAPDERSFLIALPDDAEADLMLVEGFR